MHRPVLAELPGSAADLIPSNQLFFIRFLCIVSSSSKIVEAAFSSSLSYEADIDFKIIR